MTSSAGGPADDAERWWQAYLLAESDQAGELRERAEAGDGHARRQLASWLDDRARTEDAIEVIRPLADAGDDVAALWLARWLADRDHLDELRQRAATGSYPALHELAEWLERHEHLEELRELIRGHQDLLSAWLAGRHDLRVLRLAAELGDDQARRRVQASLARLRERAEAGDERTRRYLAEIRTSRSSAPRLLKPSSPHTERTNLCVTGLGSLTISRHKYSAIGALVAVLAVTFRDVQGR
jgi:hypothetical protein